MRARADAASQTARNILTATSALWREKSLEEITLQEIAERAGVTVQTVLRRFGSKDGVVAACLETDAAGVQAARNTAPPDDPERALETLLEHYERDGDAVLRTLALEHRLAAAKAIVDAGRRSHRDWCARVFAAQLPDPDSEAYGLRLDAFVAATDLYLWKLLRRDLGYPAARTKDVFWTLLQGVMSTEESP